MVYIDELRQNATQVVGDASNQYLSPYEEWTSDELRDLLVQYKIPIRDSANASHETLVRICDKVFGVAVAESAKESRRHYSIEDLARMEAAARVIQKAFIRRQAFKRQESHQYHDYHEDECHHESFEDHSSGVEAGRYIRLRKLSMLKRICEQDDGCDDELTIEWRKPSITFAQKFACANRPHRSGKQMARYDWTRITLGRHCWASGCGEQFDLWNEGRTSEFSQHGSGITNYFKFLKWSCWVMVILSVLHLPVLILNTFGTNTTTLRAAIKDQTLAAMTTFGNLGSAMNVTVVTIPGCDETEFQFEHCKIGKNDLAFSYAFIDVVGTVVFVIAWLWLRNFEAKESRVLRRSTVSASDYTIRLTSVPDDTTEKDLAVHFAKVTGQAVAAVHLAFNNSQEIDMYIQRGKIVAARYHCVQRIRHAKTTMEDNLKRRKLLKKLMRERDEATLLVRQKDEHRSKVIINKRLKPIEAFVTFETEEGFVKAMSLYDLSWFRRNCCCYPEKLKYRGMRLKIEQAPEPSTIIWENLEYSSKGRFFRKCLTTSVALLALLLSVLTTFMARDFKSKVLMNARLPCPAGFFYQDSEGQLNLMKANMNLSHCYCSTLTLIEQWKINQCHEHLTTTSKATATSYGAGLIVVLLNYFFTWLLDKAGDFEKHRSLDEMGTSNMVRVFLLKFVNTGCLVLLYGQEWVQTLVHVRFDDAPDFNVDWYSTGGTSLIIVMAINTIVPHLGSFVAYLRHRHKIRRLEGHLNAEKETNDSYRVWYTQEELNDYYKGPEFQLNYRYTQVLVTIYVCWMYSISLPVLPILGAITCYLSYWVDKFLFCNYYRTPPIYSDAMSRTSTSLLGYLVFLHLVMSLWMMGNEEIFQGEALSGQEYPAGLGYGISANQSLRDKLLKKHLFPLEVALFVSVAWTLVSNISSTFLRKVCGFLQCLICMTGTKVKALTESMNTVTVSYSSARDRGIIKGLTSFNILQNPTYQEAFAITPDFANSHSRIESIRGYNTKEGERRLSDRPNPPSEGLGRGDDSADLSITDAHVI